MGLEPPSPTGASAHSDPDADRLSFAPASPHSHEQQGYGPPVVGGGWKAGRFSGQDFALQPDATVRCPAGKLLSAQEQRREADGSLRLVYAARLLDCRACPLREQCQWHGAQATK